MDSGTANLIAPSKICYLLFGGGGGFAQAQEKPLYLHHQDLPPVIRGWYHRLRHSQFNCTMKNLLPIIWGGVAWAQAQPLYLHHQKSASQFLGALHGFWHNPFICITKNLLPVFLGGGGPWAKTLPRPGAPGPGSAQQGR